MYKKFLMVAPVLILTMENNNNAQIPQAPCISNFYKQEIERFDKMIGRFKPSIDFESEWKNFTQTSPLCSTLLIEQKLLERELTILKTIAYMSTMSSLLKIMNLNQSTDVSNEKNNLREINKQLSDAQEKLREFSFKFDYELKREFLNKIQNKK